MSNDTAASTNVVIEALLEQMIIQRDAYLESSSRIEELLAQYVALHKTHGLDSAIGPVPQNDRSSRLSPADALSQPSSRPSSGAAFGDKAASIRTIRPESGSAHEMCACDLLIPFTYTSEDLRNHLQQHAWDASAHQILKSLINNEQRMRWPNLFGAEDLPAGRYHYSHYQIIEVNQDGHLDFVEDSRSEIGQPQAATLWKAMKRSNADAPRRNSVGRISILREPSPILLAAAHFTNLQSFDTDELLQYLTDSKPTTAYTYRLFDLDSRRQRSFVFSFKYFTLIDHECKPMEWQKYNERLDSNPGGVSMSYCGSVVALSLHSQPIRKIRNQMRTGVPFGYAYDPWGSWQVLHIQAFTDRESNLGIHEKRHYVNGVEAFMETILSEYKDAALRLRRVYTEVIKLTASPIDFVFDPQLFERHFRDDDELTYSQRYFWAYRTCGLLVDTIKAMIDAYEGTFTDEVWEGRHMSLWPLLDHESLRNKNYRNRMAVTRGRFRIEIEKLRNLVDCFNDCRAEIISLRDQLSNAISIADSRKAIQQGNNIRLLTLVSIFFLPLTYVTSVFGMTNMPQDGGFAPFSIATVAICVPFFGFVALLTGRRYVKSRLKSLSGQSWAQVVKTSWQLRGRTYDAESPRQQ